jgi:hypothetical protein
MTTSLIKTMGSIGVSILILASVVTQQSGMNRMRRRLTDAQNVKRESVHIRHELLDC